MSGEPRSETASPEETERAGAALAATLAPGDVVLVSGELGAGKTTFVRGAARALGVTEPVTSPTFVVGHLYEPGVAHLDLYRLAGLDDEDPGLLDPYFGPELDDVRGVARAARARRAAGRAARRAARRARARGRRPADGERRDRARARHRDERDGGRACCGADGVVARGARRPAPGRAARARGAAAGGGGGGAGGGGRGLGGGRPAGGRGRPGELHRPADRDRDRARIGAGARRCRSSA